MPARFDDLELLVTSDEARLCVRVRGDIDLASAATLRHALLGVLHGAGGDVDVDLSETSFCDSVGLCTLLTARREFHAAGRALRLVEPAPIVLRLLELTATSGLFDVAPRASSSGETPGD